MDSAFEFVETYRGYEISKGLKNGRLMYFARDTYTFTLEQIKKLIDGYRDLIYQYYFLRVAKEFKISYTPGISVTVKETYCRLQEFDQKGGILEICSKLALF